MSDKRNRSNPRRIFPTWLHALYMAVSYGSQTGRKWRVYRSGEAWRIQRTSKPYAEDRRPGSAAAEDVKRWDRFRAATGRPPYEPPLVGNIPNALVFVAVGPVERHDPT